MAATQITTYKNYIGGQWVDANEGATYAVQNPATEEDVALVPDAVATYEEAVRATLGELAERYPEGTRGEVCILVEGAPEPRSDPREIDAAIRRHLQSGLSARDVAATVAAEYGARKSAVYRRVQELNRRP